MDFTDPLALLREYTIQQKPVTLSTDGKFLIFGQTRFPRSTLTAYRSDRGQSDFYTLDTLWFFLQKPDLHAVNKFSQYREECKRWNIPTVRIVDRHDILQYLKGEIETSKNIVSSIDLAEATAAAAATATSGAAVRREEVVASAEVERSSKRARTKSGDLLMDDELRQSRNAYVQWVETRKKTIELSAPFEMFLPEGVSTFVNAERDVSKAIQARERCHQTPEKYLLSARRTFQQIIDIRDKALKFKSDKDKALIRKKREAAQPPPARHNRYNVTEDIAIRASGMGEDVRQFQISGTAQASFTQMKGSTKPVLPQSDPSKVRKRDELDAPWIIIVPAATTSMITMLNAKDIIEDGVFVPTQQRRDEGAKKAAAITFSRQGHNYKIVDNTTNIDWGRVVCVVAHGVEWQFKTWPYKEPVQVFERFQGVHFKFSDEATNPNIEKWNVKILTINRLQRHRDRVAHNEMWTALEYFIKTRKLK